MFKNKTLLITGGTGSFGQSFIRSVLNSYHPKRLVVFSRDELKQFEMQKKYKETHTHDVQARPMAKHTFRVERVNGIKWNMPPLRRSAIARAFTSAVHFRMHTPTTLPAWQVPCGFEMSGDSPCNLPNQQQK